MKIHQLPTAEALAALNTGTGGLAEADAARRLLEYGPNRLEQQRQTPLLLRFAREFAHFFALILWLAAGLAFFAAFAQPGEGMATLGCAILGVILVNGVFSFWQQYRAERALDALRDLLPQQVKVQRAGGLRLLPVAEVVPGDIVLLTDGDNVPADCRVIEAFALRVNNATVTGESLPQLRDAQPCTREDPMHGRNVLLAGTAVVGGEGRAVVFATGMHTEFGRIAQLTQTAGGGESPLQREIVRLSRIIAGIALLLGIVLFVAGSFAELPFWVNFMFAIGVIVANVPEGLLPTVTLSLAMATQRMARRNALIRHLPSVEALGSASVICTDKTGTLTLNRMEVQQFFLAGRLVNPAALAADAGARHTHRRLLEGALLCHGLQRLVEPAGIRWLGDPMEIALARAGGDCLGENVNYPRINEIPFDTERKRLSTVNQTPDGTLVYCKGAVETVLPLCSRVQTADGETLLDADGRARLLAAEQEMATRGLRVMGFAWRRLEAGCDGDRMEEDLVFAGLVGLEDPPRPEVPEAIRRCREAGIRVIMVTGDNPHTGVAIARQIGLIEGREPLVVGGEQLARMTRAQLLIALDAPEILFARVAAEQKMQIVNALKDKGHVVAVTGDGVNDAPALKAADIGIAMGLCGTDVAREAADMVLLDDNFASIVAAIEEGRAVFANIRRFLAYVLTSNVPELVPYLAFVLGRVPLALTIVQILAVDLGTDMLPALGLGAERPDPGLMQKPPRARGEKLIDWRLLARVYLFLGPLQAIAAMAAFWYVLDAGGWLPGDALGRHDPLYLQATTACLAAIIVMQVANVFICKTEGTRLRWRALLDNRLLLAGVAAEIVLILLIVYTAPGQALFGTAAIGADAWLFMLPFALAMLCCESLRRIAVAAIGRVVKPQG